MTALGEVPLADPISDYLGGSDMTALGDIPLTDDIEDYAGAGVPTAPVTGMRAWYDAADTGTLTIVSNKVSQWDDKSASNFDLTQATAGSRFLYNGTPRTINGIICPECTGGEFMESSCPMDDRTATVFFVGYVDAFNGVPIGDTQGGGMEIRIDVNSLIRVLKSGVAFLGNSSPVGMKGTTPDVWCVRLSDTEIIYDFPGRDASVTNSESSTFTAARTLRVGLDTSGTVPWNGLIAEILIYPTTLADADVDENLNYLVGKWLFAA